MASLSIASLSSFFTEEHKSISRGENHYQSGHVESFIYDHGVLRGEVRASMKNKVYKITVRQSRYRCFDTDQWLESSLTRCYTALNWRPHSLCYSYNPEMISPFYCIYRESPVTGWSMYCSLVSCFFSSIEWWDFLFFKCSFVLIIPLFVRSDYYWFLHSSSTPLL